MAFTKRDADGNTEQFSHDDVMELMDQINYLAAHNATTAPEVAQSVNQAASFGQIAGIDPAATAAIATAMQATGVATDRVGTSITRIYTNLSKGENATKKQKEMLEELGFTAEGVAKSLTTRGQGVSTLRSIFGAINEMPDERKVAALSTLFGQWAIEGGAKIVNNLPLLDKTLAEVQDKEAYTGSMEREFIINASTSESVSMMTSNAKTALMQDIGEQFLPVKKQFATLAIDTMNGIRHNLPELQTLASTLADIATKGVTALGDAMQSAMPYIQQGLDYLNKNGAKVAKILAGVAGAFAAMSIAPKAEIAAKGVGSVVKGGAGMFRTAVSTVSKAGGTAVKTGGNLLGGLGTLRDIVGAANQDAAMNGSSTTGVLARLALGSAKETKAGKAATSVGNWAGNLFGNAKDFALSQWDLSKGMADGAIAGANGVKSFINNIISPAETATTTALVAAAPTALTAPGTAMTAAQAPLSDMGLLGAVMSRLRGGATAAKQAAGNPLKDAGIQILQGAGGMASSAFSGAKTLATGAMPFVSAFGGIASAALPVVAVIGSIVAAVSLLGEHLDDIRNIIGNVFGEQGVAVFDGFLNTITGIKDKIVGVFSPENLASVRTAIVGMFGENAGTGFDNIVSIGQSVIGVFQQIVNFGTQTVKPMFEQVFGWVSTTLLPGLLNAFNALAPQIGPIITNIGTAVMNVANMIGNAIQAVLPVIGSIIMAILSVVSTVGPPILAAIAQIAQNIGNVITSIQGVFEGLIQFITGVFTGNWSSAWEGVKSIFSNAFSALVELCKIPINAVIGIINGAINGINSILGSVTTIPEWVPVVGGKGFGLFCDEANRSWCSSSPWNDHRAVTIEVANDGGAPNWHVSDKSMAALLDLCTDICRRNGMAKLEYTGDKNGSLTMHCFYAATACPGPYLKSKFAEIAKTVTARLAGEQTSGGQTAQEQFVKIMVEKCQSRCQAAKLLPSLCIAQACLESAYGTSELAVQANNLFGIKQGSGWKGAVYSKATKEWDGSKYITITAPFRKYDTMVACVEDYIAKLTGMERYKNLVGCTDIATACKYIREDGWATSPTYTENLLKVVDKFNLTQYDDKNTPVAPAEPAVPTKQIISIDPVELPNAAAMEFYKLAQKYGLDNDRYYHAKYVQ